MTISKDKREAEQFVDKDLDKVRGGAWGLGMRDPSLLNFNLPPEPQTDGAGFDPSAELNAHGFNPQPEPPPHPAKSKLLHK